MIDVYHILDVDVCLSLGIVVICTVPVLQSSSLHTMSIRQKKPWGNFPRLLTPEKTSRFERCSAFFVSANDIVGCFFEKYILTYWIRSTCKRECS